MKLEQWTELVNEFVSRMKKDGKTRTEIGDALDSLQYAIDADPGIEVRIYYDVTTGEIWVQSDPFEQNRDA